MALAPLSQTILLTEDGSAGPVTVQVVVPVAQSTTPPSFTTEPSISGTLAVGQTLTGNTGTIVNGSVSAVQWTRNGSPISGATSATYVLVTADAGKAVTFRVTATGSGGTETATAAAVTIPAYTVSNTLAGSTLPSAQVEGEPAIYAANYPRVSAVKARSVAVRNRRLALIPRITVLEGGTAGAVTIPPATTDPAYGAGDQVVANATRFDGFLGNVATLRATEAAALAATRTRVNALKNPPANTLTYQGQVLTRQGLPLTYGASA